MSHRSSPDSPEITINELKKGAFFGEKALLGYVDMCVRVCRYVCMYVCMHVYVIFYVLCIFIPPPSPLPLPSPLPSPPPLSPLMCRDAIRTANIIANENVSLLAVDKE